MGLNQVSSEVIIQKSCNSIVENVRSSFLNHALQESPFSVFITLRKSLNLKNIVVSNNLVKTEGTNTSDEDILCNDKNTKDAFENLQHDYEGVITVNKEVLNQIQELKKTVQILHEI